MVKLVMAAVAVVLLVGYLAPVVIKLKDVPMTLVMAIGIALMLVDLWHSLRSKDD
jgi:sugar phosphate permease